MKDQKKTMEILQDKNITPSYTRMKIYDYLAKDQIHPTVDEIFIDLSQIFPSLSKTTVYNTLKLFVKRDLIKPVNINDNKMRYELLRSDHAHFKCNICSEIYDIPIQIDIDLPEELKGSIINENHNLLIGTCSNCLNKE